jgi:hypothetical protein
MNRARVVGFGLGGQPPDVVYFNANQTDPQVQAVA